MSFVKHYNEDEHDTEEGFCTTCIAAPIAMSGVVVGGGEVVRQSYNNKKWILFGVISLAIASILYVMYGSSCTSCKKSK